MDGYFDLGIERLENLESALCAIGSVRRYFSDSFLRQQDERRDNPSAYSKILSDRQIVVLQLVASFSTDLEISQALGLSVRTVEWHRLEIMKKLEKASMQELLKYAWDHGFVPTLTSDRCGSTESLSIPKLSGSEIPRNIALVPMDRQAS